MKKSDKKQTKKPTFENLVEDTEKLLQYVNDLNNLDLEDLNLDEIQKTQKEFEEKYKHFLPKDNLDSKE
tara:strand:+ start:514 stop:720 length:207 start_codon:yes stop_codon:yes gene_type:complete